MVASSLMTRVPGICSLLKQLHNDWVMRASSTYSTLLIQAATYRPTPGLMIYTRGKIKRKYRTWIKVIIHETNNILFIESTFVNSESRLIFLSKV
jgi:hypothetical protein